MRNDSMTIGASYDAFGDFCLRLCNTLCVADVERLIGPIKMLKVKSAWVCKSTINTTDVGFIEADPLSNHHRSCVGNSIFSCSIPCLLKPSCTPKPSLRCSGLHTLRSCPALANGRAKLRLLLCKKGSLALSTGKLFGLGVIVGFHKSIITYPCKPDIFAVTYEAVE